MSELIVTPDTAPHERLMIATDPDRIAEELAKIGVQFERWDAAVPLGAGADQAAVLEAYKADVARLSTAHGYQSVDVVRMKPDHPDRAAMRAKFLAEHIHEDDEVRFFVEGQGAFYLRVGGKVYRTVCVAGDLISVPKNTTHWFDAGDRPLFCAIRLFTTSEGWVAKFTGDKIAESFPEFVNPETREAA
ncbi:MAG: cupin domain-containing protein [Alphaproteobacteria bacterium]|nr:cupin domain-containing protein [Alphaproteobacteria bacterium]